MAVQITISDLTEKVNSGLKKKALAEHYGLPMSQMGKVLKDAGLTIRKFHAPKYELIDDTIPEEVTLGVSLEEAQDLIEEETLNTEGTEEVVAEDTDQDQEETPW